MKRRRKTHLSFTVSTKLSPELDEPFHKVVFEEYEGNKSEYLRDLIIKDLRARGYDI